MALIELDDVRRIYNLGDNEVRALDGVSLRVERGEFVAIDRALERLQPGDLCLVLVDQVEEALAHLAQRISQG